jgi:hypothetical protein
MPLRSQLRPVDPLLTNFALEFSQSMAGKAADLLFPMKPTKGETGTYFIYDANDRFRTYGDLRADPGEANAIEWKLTSAVFAQEEYALKTHITDRERENAIDPISLDQDAAVRVTEALTLNRELRARDLLFPTATQEATVSIKWDQASATPLSDNEAAKQAFMKLTGKEPNWLMIPPVAWKQFMNDAAGTIGQVLNDRLKYTMATTGKNITPALVGQLFNIPNVVVPNLLHSTATLTNTAQGGGGVQSGAFIWDTAANAGAIKQITYLYLDPSAGAKGMTYGMCFQSQPYTVFRYREDKLRTDWIEASRVETFKEVATACRYRLNVLT